MTAASSRVSNGLPAHLLGSDAVRLAEEKIRLLQADFGRMESRALRCEIMTFMRFWVRDRKTKDIDLVRYALISKCCSSSGNKLCIK
jgi:hypothetical protein